ncbi:MAG TPA: dTMP kinase [Candidatus Deferrimicrobiaceae bacterium]|nr:dTMP kinase [Candidatus Deferrimicrobiaceae bacterium]
MVLDKKSVPRKGAPFVTFEGIEGSGKTTQLGLLAEYLAGRGIPHVVTREPGGTPLADEIRRLLLSPREERVFPETELLLYQAARAQHVRAVILPALSSGTAVLCDRFCDATSAYQGFSRGIDGAQVDRLNAFASGGLVPDLTFLFDIAPEDGFRRLHGRGTRPDRMESEALAFHRKVREGYLRLQERDPGRIVRIDGTPPADEVFRHVRAGVAARLGW